MATTSKTIQGGITWTFYFDPLLHIGTGNRDYFKDRIGRGCKTRRCGLPDGCGIPDTVICGVFGLDCAKDSEVGR